jgi:hypothetical protein
MTHNYRFVNSDAAQPKKRVFGEIFRLHRPLIVQGRRFIAACKAARLTQTTP